MLMSVLMSLSGMITAHVALSAPFCVLQLALCRYSRSRVIQAAPLAASLVGMACGVLIMEESGGWDALMGLLILFPAWLCLVGCGLGWLIWRQTQGD